MNSEHEFRPPLVALKAAADEAFKEQNTFVACELDEARSAVAELIVVATAARDHVRPTCTELFERLDAALARCKGGSL